LSLTRRRDFVMLALDRHARLLQLETHFIAIVLQGVGWWHRKITFLCADLVTEIGKCFARTVPMRFGALDLIKGGVRGRRKAHVIENEKLRLRSETRGVGDASTF